MDLVRIAAWSLAGGLLLFAPRAVRAHHISVVRGTATVSEGRVTVSLEVCAEDFLHFYGDSAPNLDRCTTDWLQSAVRRHESYIADHLIMRNQDGERVAVRPLTSEVRPAQPHEFEWSELKRVLVVYSFEFHPSRPTKLLIFQQTFGDGALDLPSQVLLAVIGAGGGPMRSLNLTSGGNVEAVELCGPKLDQVPMVSSYPPTGSASKWVAAGYQRLWETRLSEMTAAYFVLGESVRLEIQVPWRLLESWFPMSRAAPDFVSPAEQSEMSGRLRAAAPEFNTIKCDGQELQPLDISIAALGPFDSIAPFNSGWAYGPLHRKATDRLSFWTARVVIVLNYHCLTTEPRSLEAEWKWFNSSVVTVRALAVYRIVMHEFEFTTYQPRHEFATY